MKITHPLRGTWLAAALAALAALAGAAVLLLAHTAAAPAAAADDNLNNLSCKGHVEKGDPAKDESGDTQVKYVFACSGPITGYQIQPNVQVQSYETEVFGLDPGSSKVIPSDSFSCNGELPGYGINCVGTAGFLDNKTQTYDATKKSHVVIPGQFTIAAADLCAEPRVDPLLTVVTAIKNATTGAVVQSIAGPFELGRPQGAGCKPSALNGTKRLPTSGPGTSDPGTPPADSGTATASK